MIDHQSVAMAHVYRKLKLADDYPITASCKSDTPLNDEFVVRVSMLRVFHMGTREESGCGGYTNLCFFCYNVFVNRLIVKCVMQREVHTYLI